MKFVLICGSQIDKLPEGVEIERCYYGVGNPSVVLVISADEHVFYELVEWGRGKNVQMLPVIECEKYEKLQKMKSERMLNDFLSE